MSEKIRLNKLLAQQLGLSRRKIDEYIAQGRVSVDGASVELGARVTPGADRIEVDGKPLAAKSAEILYIALNKPGNYVSSRRRQGENPTIYELLPEKYHPLKPVGRLDKDSSGILLLTNDGDFAHSMTHPSFQKIKIYEVTLDKPLTTEDKVKIEAGVTVENYTSCLQLSNLGDNSWRVQMQEGRNRQIRRTFAALGYSVMTLHRTAFGPYELSGLEPGSWRFV